MKLIKLVCLILMMTADAKAGIVSNGSSSEDSLSISIVILDSLGNPDNLSADSFYISVLGPSGDSIKMLAGVAATSGLAIDSVSVSLIGKKYIFSDAVSNLDGSGRPGIYELVFCAKKNLPELVSCHSINFQVSVNNLSVQLSEVADILDSLQNQDNWVAKENTLGSIDSEAVAGWIWNTPQVNHLTNGTFGDYLDADISGIGSGSGLYSFEIILYESANAQVVPGANIAVKNLSQSSLIAVGATGLDGSVSFNLDNGSYLVIARSPGYIFNSFDTVVVSGVAVDTVFGRQFDPGLPSLGNLCRVYGYLYDINGQPKAEAVVTVSLPGGVVKYQDLIISPFKVSAVSDSLGYFYLDLIPSDSLTPIGEVYEFTVNRRDGVVLRKRLTVPSAASWLLTW